ncbi:hypothetical protein ACLB2K_071563 [Fragaria x ananassa]
MADKYGPLFTIKLGVHRALVESNWDVAKECLTTNDKAFANRPKSLVLALTDLTGARMVVGKRFFVDNSAQENEENERFRKALREFSRLGGEFVISDAVPYLRWLDLGGYEKAMKKTTKELDGALQKWLDGHKHKRRTNSMQHVNGENDFMDMMLSALDDDCIEEIAGSITADTIFKATCLAVLLGGTDTTTVTLTWALSLLLNNPEVLKKAQLELDSHVGRERQMNESDVKNLVYLQAIVKDTLRLYPAGPLSAT